MVEGAFGSPVVSEGSAGGGKWSVFRTSLTGHLISTQVIDQRLHVGEDTLGVGLLAHYHHVLHFQQGHAVRKDPE